MWRRHFLSRSACAGGFIQLKALGISFLSGTIGPCPAPQDVCGGLGCPGDCSGSRRGAVRSTRHRAILVLHGGCF